MLFAYAQELGRWITPFRRGVGHWLTDVTPLLPLLSSQQCNFSANIVSWLNTPSWVISLNLRFNKTDTDDTSQIDQKNAGIALSSNELDKNKGKREKIDDTQYYVQFVFFLIVLFVC